MQGGVGKTLTIWFQNSNKHKKSCKGSNIGTVVFEKRVFHSTEHFQQKPACWLQIVSAWSSQ